MKRLEEMLDVPRDEWPPSALRTLWDPLLACGREAAEGPAARVALVQSGGFLPAPGRGFPLDDVRIKALWPIFHQGVKHIKDVQCWAEWWILWRRVAAGLARPHHEEIYRRLAPFLLPVKGSSPAKKAGRPKPEAHEMAEMWRCAASLERVAPDVKEALGDALIKEFAQPVARAHVYWCLGRLGAGCRSTDRRIRSFARRQPSAGRTCCSITRSPPGRETGDAIFALAQLARVANDRARDLEDPLRADSDRAPDRSGCRRERTASRFANTTSWNRPSKSRPWATRCRSG